LNLGSVLVHSGYGWRIWQVAPVFSSTWWSADSFRIQLLCLISIRSRGSHRYSPSTRPDTLVPMATTTTTSTGSKMGHLLIGAVGIRHHLGVLSCVWGSFGRLLVSFRKKGFFQDTLGLPLAPPGAAGGLRFFPIPSLVLDST
jgi:hypothetical protein